MTLYNLNYSDTGENQAIDIEKTVDSEEKPAIDKEKTGVSDKKQAFEARVSNLTVIKKTKEKIKLLYQEFGEDKVFGRGEIMEITGIAYSASGELIKKLISSDLIVKVKGRGKVKYKFNI